MSNRSEVWTVVRLIGWSADFLAKKGIDDARLNVERLLGHVLGCPRVQLYLDFDRPLREQELKEFKKLLLRRAAREPIQYILGETEFYSLAFAVRPGVLIPRPETEILVEHGLTLLKNFPHAPKIVDVGTGSGVIAITLALHIPAAKVIAFDISDLALQIAAENAQRHQITDRITFASGDILDPQKWPISEPNSIDLIVANPPYISLAEAETLQPEIRHHEPGEALFAAEPLLFYRALADFTCHVGTEMGYLACEIAPHRQAEVERLFTESGFRNISIVPDLSGRPRVLSAQRPAR